MSRWRCVMSSLGLSGISRAQLPLLRLQEHSLWCQFQLCVWRQVLSPFQAASLMLQVCSSHLLPTRGSNRLSAVYLHRHGCFQRATLLVCLPSDSDLAQHVEG
jgi:hypothetical protein